MSWLAWLVLLLSVAGNVAMFSTMIPPSMYKAVSNVVLPANEPHPMPVVIPRARINCFFDTPIPDDAAVLCDRDLKNCIPFRIPGWIDRLFAECDKDGICTATVLLNPAWIFAYPLVCMSVIAAVVGVLCVGMYLSKELPRLGDWVAMKVWDQNDDCTFNEYFKRRAAAYMRYNVFCWATGYWADSKQKPAKFATFSNMSTITFTPDEGFRLYLLWDGAPELPVWRFRRVEKPPTPMRVRKEWAEAVKMRDTTGVRIDVGAGIGIEWRTDGGMRVWIGDTHAYDSYVPEPVSVPPTE